MESQIISGLKAESEKAINATGKHPYLAKLYSKEECDRYGGNVWNKEPDEFNGEYCTRWVETWDLYEGQSDTSKSSSSAMNNLPLNSVTLDSSKSIAFINFSALGGCEIKTIIPENWAGGNKTELRKSLSLDNKVRPLSSAKDASTATT